MQEEYLQLKTRLKKGSSEKFRKEKSFGKPNPSQGNTGKQRRFFFLKCFFLGPEIEKETKNHEKWKISDLIL